MSQSVANLTAFRATPAPLASEISRAAECAAPHAPVHEPRILIATINRAVGDTGVQTHTRTLHAGLGAAGIACEVVTPFSRPALWLPVFAMRKLIAPINPSASTRWYRHWHAAALRQALVRQIRADRIVRLGGCVSCCERFSNNASAKADPTETAVLAQCPVSAQAALEVRNRLGLDFPVAMVCHFNFSEATEYRDKGELPNEKAYRAMLDFEQRVLSSVDRIIYVSSWAKRIVEEERGIKVRSSSVIWNGIAATSAKAISRAELGLDPSDLVLMNVGTLEKRKNQLGLIDLFAAIAAEHPGARLVLVGEGPQRPEIRKRIDERGLASKVRMLGMRHDVPALLGAADLYIHYAALENCPVVLLEAGRAGLPIAAAPGGGVPELLKILGGVSLDSNDISRSLAGLRPLLADASARMRAGQLAQAAFHRTFTREAMVAAYLKAMAISSSNPQEVRS